MRLFFYTLLFGAFAAQAQINIQSNPHVESETLRIDAAAIGNRSRSPQETSEDLAKAAEQLVQMSGFMYAKPILDRALELDPENFRAQVWSKQVQILEAFRGVHTKMRPLIERLPHRDYDSYQYEMARFKAQRPAVFQFLADNGQAFRNESDLQELLDEVIARMNELREFIRLNKDKELQITIFETRMLLNREYQQQALDDCYVRAVNIRRGGSSPLPTLFIDGCEIIRQRTVKIDFPDFEAYQHLVAGTQILAIVKNSYHLSGSIEAYKKGGSTTAEIVDNFFNNIEFGKLRTRAAMQFVKTLGVDAVSGYKYFLKIQEDLCPYGLARRQQRPGQLFSGGICVVGDEARNNRHLTMLAIVENSLLGGITNITQTNDGVPKPTELLDPSDWVRYQTDAQLGRPVLQPVEDLRVLKPTAYNSCGHPIAIEDPSADGFLPNRDAETVLRVYSGDGCD